MMTLKILMADDDADDRNLFRIAFEIAFPSCKGPQPIIEFVRDGLELMNFVNALNADELPDIIFLDLNMPRKDGREALKEIKSNQRFKNIHIIILSTSISEADKKFAMENGARYYIEKPVDFFEWPEIIKKVCASIENEIFQMESKH